MGGEVGRGGDGIASGWSAVRDAEVGVAGMALTSRRWLRRVLMEELDGVEEVMEELGECSLEEGKELSSPKFGTLLPVEVVLPWALSSTSLASATNESSLRDTAGE